MRSRWLTIVGALSLAMLLGAGTALAAPIQITFDIAPPTTGTLIYPGGATPLTGTAIQVDTVAAVGTPTNAGTYDLLGGTLDFVTGLALGTSGNTTTFASGGSVRVGGVLDADDDGVADAGEPAGILLIGTFSSNPQVVRTESSASLAFGLLADIKNPVMLAFFGVSTMTDFKGTLTLNFARVDTTDSGFTAVNDQIGSGGIVNTEEVAQVPEPTTLMLLGAGMVMAGAVARRRQRNT